MPPKEGQASSPEKPSGGDSIMDNRQHRKCQNIFWLILYVLFFVGFIVITSIGISKGNIKRLLYANDYEGNVCGIANDGHDLTTMRHIVYPRLDQDLQLNKWAGINDIWKMSFFGICVKSCPGEYEYVCKYDTEQLLRDEYGSAPEEGYENWKTDLREGCDNGTSTSTLCPNITDHCWSAYLAMDSVFYRCIPLNYEEDLGSNVTCIYPPGVTDPTDDQCKVKQIHTNTRQEKPATTTFIYDRLNQARGLWMQYFGDLTKTFGVIVLFGIVVALALAFCVSIFLHFCTKFLIWLILILIFLLSVGFTVYLYFRGGIIKSSTVDSWTHQISKTVSDKIGTNATVVLPDFLTASEENTKWFKVGAYCMTGFSVILLVVIIVIRSKINDASEMIQMSSGILIKNMMLLLVPVVVIGLIIAVLAGGIFVSAELVSAGSIKVADLTERIPSAVVSRFPDAKFKSVEDDGVMKYLLIYVIFWAIWTIALVQSFGLFSIANTTATSYYDGRNSICTPCKSVAIAFRYYFGTLIFGSFLIAFLTVIRIIFEFIDRKTKDAQAQSCCVKCLMKCIRCCLCCLDCCLKYINKCVYTIVAIDGSGYCEAAKSVFKIFLDNIALLTLINAFTSVFFFLGKIAIMVGASWLSFSYLDGQAKYKQGGESELTSYWLTVLCVFIAAFAVCTAFFYVYDMIIDSLVMCFTYDKMKNGGEAKHCRVAALNHKYKEAQRALEQQKTNVPVAQN